MIMAGEPGRTYYIESLGCISNKADTHRVSVFLERNGFSRVLSPEAASLVVLMTCAFDGPQEERSLGRVTELQADLPASSRLIVGGCLAGINKPRLAKAFSGTVITPRTLGRLDQVIEAMVPMDAVHEPLRDEGAGMHVIRVSTGCMHNCTFCAIPFANGRTVSRPLAAIVADVSRAVADGAKKIRLVSEDVGAYGLDIDSSIIRLIEELLALNLPVELYLDYMNLQWVYRFRDELFPLLAEPAIAKHFYWPVQSGSNRVLERMQRGYTAGQARALLDRLFEEFPGVEVTSDFIVGFPGETDDDFEETRELLASYPFFYCNVFKFEERPRTPASTMSDKVDDKTKERRFQVLVKDAIGCILSSRRLESLTDLAAASKSPSGLINVNATVG